MDNKKLAECQSVSKKIMEFENELEMANKQVVVCTVYGGGSLRILNKLSAPMKTAISMLVIADYEHQLKKLQEEYEAM